MQRSRAHASSSTTQPMANGGRVDRIKREREDDVDRGGRRKGGRWRKEGCRGREREVYVNEVRKEIRRKGRKC